LSDLGQEWIITVMQTAEVQTPDIVGELFHVAREHVMGLGLELEGSDPDGPPIIWSAWPGYFQIVTQSPAPGTTLHRGQSIRVTLARETDNQSGVPARPSAPPPHLNAAAERAEEL